MTEYMAVTIQQLMRWKQQGKPIAVLTAWDYLWAKILDQAGVDIILVGDSLGMVALGFETTLPVSLEEMLHHAKAVRRGVKRAMVVLDLPFMSYQTSTEQALQSAGRSLKEAGVNAVKIEGGYPALVEKVERLVQAGIPVMGHLGLTPQSVQQMGGFRQQGTTPESAEKLIKEAIALEQAGAFSLVLEHIPSELAAQVTEKLSIPTIGIGAGTQCDGQVLVTADMLGLSDWHPPFAKVYSNVREQAFQAVSCYCNDVRSRQFPPQ